jgi:hypothetical protein
MDFSMDFGCFESVSSMFCLNLFLILNMTNSVFRGNSQSNEITRGSTELVQHFCF